MRIERPLLKLPIRFCAETLAAEVAALPADSWTVHPQKFEGNMAVPLVSPGGAVSDEWRGPMGPTDALRRSPYIMQIMAELDSTWGRSRLMSLAPGAVVPSHVDVHYYWRTHLRIHIPVITNPGVAFTCDGETVRMLPGECWLLDSFHRHSVENRGADTRVHLVLDTVGSVRLWELIDAALTGQGGGQHVPPGASPAPALKFEQINAPDVMSPWEMKAHVTYLFSWTDDEPRLPALRRSFDRFLMAWGGTWARFGAADDGLPNYVEHLREIQAVLAAIPSPPILMRNGWGLRDCLQRFVLANAIAPARLGDRPAVAGGGVRSRLTA